MERITRGDMRCRWLAIMVGSLACFNTIVCADTTPQWTTKPIKFVIDKRSFAAILTALSRQIGKNIVVDDEPLLKSAAFNIDGTTKDVLDKVAATFDYSWTLSRSGVIMLTKRFQSPDEVPQMNLPELRQMVKQSLAALSNVQCDTQEDWWCFQCKTLFELFSSQQQQDLKAGQSIGYADWTAEQRTLTRQMVVNRRFAGILRGWKYIDMMLSGFSRAAVQMQRYRVIDGNYVPASGKQKGSPWLCYLYPQTDKEELWMMYGLQQEPTTIPQKTEEAGQ